MIKIENTNLDQIAQEYFDDIKVKILSRSDYFLKVFDVLFNHTRYAIIENDPLNGNTKKSLINLFLANNRLNDQEHFQDVVLANCHPWVIANQLVLNQIALYLNTESNLKELLLCKPDDAILTEQRIKAAVGITAANFTVDLFSFVSSIINYDIFDSFAYKIASDIGINTCPYCNRNYINTVIDKRNNRIIRPTFDHFFPQNKHPFLALSFYNLIPSCYFCNSSLKGADSMDIATHIHPYKEGFENDASFQVLIQRCKPNKSDPENYSLILIDNSWPGSLIDRYRKLFGGTRTVPNTAEGNINLFKLNEIYQSHLDIVGELIVKCDSLKEAYPETLKSLFESLNTNKAEFYRFYFGNYFNEKDFHRRPMAKLSKDVVSQVLPSFVK